VAVRTLAQTVAAVRKLLFLLLTLLRAVMTETMATSLGAAFVTKSYVKNVAKNGKTTATPKAKIVKADYGDAGRKAMTNAIKGSPKRKKK